jgi:hypothetical protein
LRRGTPDFLGLGAVLAHLLVGLMLRTIAWPEVTTPAYLWSRGLLLYRDVKFVHTPGTIGLLALVFALFGVGTGVVRVFALAFPLLAHWQLLKQTRAFSPLSRILASAFFLVLLFEWQGNSVWPSALLTAFALPIASLFARRRVAAAGCLIGAAILIKQTAAYVLLLAAARLLWEKRVREAGKLVLCASVPYALGAAVFALLGSGPDYLRWTILVPFTILKGVIDARPGPQFLLQLGIAFSPLVLYALRERREDARREAAWLLLTAAGFALMAYPRFMFLHVLPAVPCLALGVARLLEQPGRWLAVFSRGLVATLVLGQAAMLAAGESFDGKVLFWNEPPAFEALVRRLRRFPAGTPLSANIWDNVLPRTGLLPPGRLYYHPWLAYLGAVDSLHERVGRAAAQPGTVVVDYRRVGNRGEILGPYSIRVR